MILRDFRGGETGLNMLTYNKQKKTSAFLPRLGGSSPFFFFLPSLSFIYYYAIPWPRCCVNTDKSKSSHEQVQLKLPLGQLPGNVIAQLG